MNDSELSLKVAEIMWPDYKCWADDYCGEFTHIVVDIPFDQRVDDIVGYSFNYTTDDALGKMCVWLATRTIVDVDTREIRVALRDLNPHKAIAEAIVECMVKVMI